MNKKLRWCKFHEDVFIRGFGNAGSEIDSNTQTSRYKSIDLSCDVVGVHLDLTSNQGGKFKGFAPWTMVKCATFAPDDSPQGGGSNKLQAA